MITGKGPTRYTGAEGMEHLIGQGVQIVRNTMLKQEAIFKEQLRELHRVYNIQKHLMDEMKRGGLPNPLLLCRDRSVKFPAGGCQYEDYSYGMPFEGATSKLTLDCHNKLHVGAHEDINLNVSFYIFEKPEAILANGSVKTKKISFDLERLPEEYIDDQVIEEARASQENCVNARKTGKGKTQFPGDCFVDKRMLSILKSSHKEKVNCAEEGCLPITEYSDQSHKPSVSSERELLGALFGVKQEKSSGQESRSSRLSESFSAESNKKVRSSFSLEAEDIFQNMTKIQRETQGCISDEKTLMQDYPNSKTSIHLLRLPEWPGESFWEGKQAGQLWWNSFQTQKNVGGAHPKGQSGHFMTTESSNAERQSPGSSFSLKERIYGIHLPKSTKDSTQSLGFLRESQAEDITGMWYNSRTEFPYFSQLQHHHISPGSSPLGVSRQTPDCVNSNVTYSSSGGVFSDGVSKSRENFGTSCQVTASGGSIIPTFSVASTQPFANYPKRLVDKIPMELKLVSSNPLHKEMIQKKVSREKNLKLLPRTVKESFNNHTDRNIHQGCDLESREALNIKADCCGSGHPRSGIECGRKIAESKNLSMSYAKHGLHRAADLTMIQEFVSENKAINSQVSDLDIDIKLRSENLLSNDGIDLVRTDGSTVFSVPAPCGESLSSNKTMQVRKDIDSCEIASMTVRSTELLTKSELIESENDQAKVEKIESGIAKIKSDDKLTKERSFKEEGQPLPVETNQSVAIEQPKKLQACVIPESLAKDKSMDSGTLSQSTCQAAESKLLNCSESLRLTKPREDIIASFGSTVTTAEDILRPQCADSLDLCEDESTQNPGFDLLTPTNSSLHLNSKVSGYDPLLIEESSKPLEVVGRAQPPVPTSNKNQAIVAILSHSSALTAATAAHPTRQHSSEACSHLNEGSTNVKSRSQNVSRKMSEATRLSPGETSDDEHSFYVDESANLAASILVSLLPNASLPPKSSEKKRSRRPLLRSFSSSADDQGKCGSCNTLQKSNRSPSVRMENNAFNCTKQFSPFDQASNNETIKTERSMPDNDSNSLNIGNHNASYELHRQQIHGKEYSEKIPSTKRTKLNKEAHSKTLPSLSPLRTPESVSGDSSDANAHRNKYLLRHGNVAEHSISKEIHFEGEGSNQVIGQQACKPEAPDNSEEEDLWSPNSQHFDSKDPTIKAHSDDPFLCIKSWGVSTRKRRMQRRSNPAFHKQQKSCKILPSKLHS